MKIVRDDVDRATTDAIVDSSCGEVQVGAGMDSAVFSRGGQELWTRRQALGMLGEGTAAAVAADGELGCRYVVFTVVPPRQEGEGRDGEETLRACCLAAMEAARAVGCESVAFPLLGTGTRGYPPEMALRAALDILGAEEDEGGMACSLYLDPTVAVELARSAFGDVEDWLGANFLQEEAILRRADACDTLDTLVEAFHAWMGGAADEDGVASMRGSSAGLRRKAFGRGLPPDLERLVAGVGPGVGKALMALMNRKHVDNRRLILKTGISKQLLSKIQNGKHAKAPEKRWLLAFAVALGLTLDETREFLATAGYALSRASKVDVVVEYYLGRGHARIEVVDAALACCGLPTLYPDE